MIAQRLLNIMDGCRIPFSGIILPEIVRIVNNDEDIGENSTTSSGIHPVAGQLAQRKRKKHWVSKMLKSNLS